MFADFLPRRSPALTTEGCRLPSLPASPDLWYAGLCIFFSCDSPAGIHFLLRCAQALADWPLAPPACLPHVGPHPRQPNAAGDGWWLLPSWSTHAGFIWARYTPPRFPSQFLLPSSLYFRLSPSFSLHPDSQSMTFSQRKLKPWFWSFFSFPPGILTHPSFLLPFPDSGGDVLPSVKAASAL